MMNLGAFKVTCRPARLMGFLVLVLATCSNLNHITVHQTSTTTVAKATPLQALLGNIDFAGFNNIDFSQNDTIKNQGITKNEIESVKVKSFTLAITAPTTADFSFLASIKFFVTCDGHPKQLIASGENFGAQKSIGLDVTDTDIGPCVVAPSMTISSDVTGQPPPNDTTINADIAFDVGVDIKGALCGSR